MPRQKMYHLEILNQLKVEVNKFKQSHNNETTLDNILIESRKEIMPLLRAGYSYKDVATILKNMGINVGMQRLKKLYPLQNKHSKANKTLTDSNLAAESNSDQADVNNIKLK